MDKGRTYEISYITLSHYDLTQLLLQTGKIKDGGKVYPHGAQQIFGVEHDPSTLETRIQIGTEVPYANL